jgi:hypothetical protein
MSPNVPKRDVFRGTCVPEGHVPGRKILLDGDITLGLSLEGLPRMSRRQKRPEIRISGGSPNPHSPIFLHFVKMIPPWVTGAPMLGRVFGAFGECRRHQKTIPSFHILKRILHVSALVDDRLWLAGRHGNARFDNKHGDISK